MHKCQISDILSFEEANYLQEVVECALQEAGDVLKIHEEETPPLFESTPLSEQVQIYSNIVSTAKGRLRTLTRVNALLKQGWS